MSLRKYIQQIQSKKRFHETNRPVSKILEASGLIKAIEPEPICIREVKESAFPVWANLFSSKTVAAEYFHKKPDELIHFLSEAIKHPRKAKIVPDAPCQEVVIGKPELDLLPILFHCEKDGGNYISSGVFIVRHPEFGQNMDFHRAMQFSKTEMAIRVVQNRHFDRFLKDLGQLDVAICIGNTPSVLIAAATSVDLGVDEMNIANAMEEQNVVKAISSDLLIPADCEFVLEGTVYLDRRHAEGPFVDLTETYDFVRNEPVFELKTVTHRKDAFWHALLPGGLEHKLLMGMPREPTIFNSVNKEVRCLDVNVNPGGCSWLHAIVKIQKNNDDDGEKALRAAFAGHKSCKHVFVVDDDIDIYDPLSVEWAMATRFQGDRGIVDMGREKGSSLDPSADPETSMTAKIGFDLTKPLKAKGKDFSKASYPVVDPRDFLSDKQR